MRVISRISLVVILAVCFAPSLIADHLTADCPLTLTGQSSPPTTTAFAQSPHAVFRSGSQVFVLRGQTLTTYAVTDLGDLQVAREDFIGSMASRESNGGTAFNNGFMFLSSEAGIEIYDLRGVRAGGNAPILVSRTTGVHYRRLAVSGTTLAALYPLTDLPCYPSGAQGNCTTQVDLYNISNLGSPIRVGSISSFVLNIPFEFVGFNDIAFNFGKLVVAAETGTFVFDIANPGAPNLVEAEPQPGRFLASNGSNLLAIGSEESITTATMISGGAITPFAYYSLPQLQVEHSNPIIFHRQAWIDDQVGRLITLIDERDPQTLQPARTIAFDVFDFTASGLQGSDPRLYEAVSMISPDEIKWNPVAVGPVVYVVGEASGLQTYGACGQLTGKFDWDGLTALNCGGAELHGWVTGDQKVANVEIFLDAGSLGAATLNTVPRPDISSRTPVSSWRIGVNLDATPRGEHILRAVGTDVFGNRRQFSSMRVFFNGPGSNCSNRRRTAGRG
jgi:hypothetical protein